MKTLKEIGARSYHEKIEIDRALCIYLLAKSEGFSFSNPVNDYSGICKEVNDLFSDRKDLFERDVRSLLRHCSHRKLKMIDFLPRHLERAYERVLQENVC